MKNIEQSRKIVEKLIANLTNLSQFHYEIRDKLYGKNLGNHEKHLKVLRKLESLEKRAYAIVYHKSRISELIQGIDFKGLENGKSFEKRDDRIEFEFDALIFVIRSLLDIFASFAEWIIFGKEHSRSFKKLKNELKNAPKTAKNLIDQLTAVLYADGIWGHLSKYISDDSTPSRRDQIAHKHHLNYSMCIYGLDENGQKYYLFPSEGGEDMWEFTDSSIEKITLIFEKVIPLLHSDYLVNNRTPESLSQEEQIQKRNKSMQATERSCVLHVLGPINSPLEIFPKK